MCESVGNSNCTVIMAPSSTPRGGWDLGQDGKLWNGRSGRSGKLSHSTDVIGCSKRWFACMCVCGSAHCGYLVNGSVAMAAVWGMVEVIKPVSQGTVSTLYIGIAMVFVFPPHIRKGNFYFSVSTFTTQNMWKIISIRNISLNDYLLPFVLIITKLLLSCSLQLSHWLPAEWLLYGLSKGKVYLWHIKDISILVLSFRHVTNVPG